MIERLQLTNFTVFAEADLQFSSQLNVIIGENGTGKTHLLKGMYALLFAVSSASDTRSLHQRFSLRVVDKFMNVFRADELWSLVRQDSQPEATIRVLLNSSPHDVIFSLRSGLVDYAEEERDWKQPRPVYLPTRELLSIYPNFVSVYETTALSFDETWRDTAVVLGAPLRRSLATPEVANLLKPLEAVMGGTLLVKEGRFYLDTGEMLLEIPLLAEGLRKIGMLAQLIANGSLRQGTTLFWDEPEANLNPKLIRQVARTILALAQQGVQVFLATHSLFLLRELEILHETEPVEGVNPRYFGLHRSAKGVQVMQGDSGDEIGDITALDEELKQTDRFLQANAQAAARQSAKRKRK